MQNGKKYDYTADAPSVMRLMFGPANPYSIVELNGNAAILNAWCPLPLYIGAPDWA